jgi:hypothetical protein
MTIAAYPLTWPAAFPRSKLMESGSFRTCLPAAIKNVDDSLRRFANASGKKLEGVVMSSNVTLGVQKPADPGVAVWFVWDGLGICIAVDRYLTVEANLQAIHHILEARLVELRHGTLALVRATFHGFLALPAPAGTPPKRDWWDVLGVPRGAGPEAMQRAYRALASQHHPDKGGDPARMAEINAARIEAGL